MKETETEKRLKNRTYLCMYNQFNYFYEIVFSVWFIFGFAFCLLPCHTPFF